jgi:hypothetical protein
LARSFHWNGKRPYWTGSPRERHDRARRPSSNAAIASFVRDAEPGVEDCADDDSLNDTRKLAMKGAIHQCLGAGLLPTYPGSNRNSSEPAE